MKITEKNLRNIIKESVKKVLNEAVINDNDKIIDILSQLINQDEVIINVNSEKTAKTWKNKTSKFLNQLIDYFYWYRYETNVERAFNDTNLIEKLSTICSNPKMLIEVYIKLGIGQTSRYNFDDDLMHGISLVNDKGEKKYIVESN